MNHEQLTDAQLRCRYVGASDATDRDTAHALCVEMRRRGMRVPSWPGIHEMPAELAAVTPPGVMLLAVLREAGQYGDIRSVRRAVGITYPGTMDPQAWGRDLRHALASGLVVEHGERWALGPRASEILATMPDDGPHAAHARVAWKVTSR